MCIPAVRDQCVPHIFSVQACVYCVLLQTSKVHRNQSRHLKTLDSFVAVTETD